MVGIILALSGCWRKFLRCRSKIFFRSESSHKTLQYFPSKFSIRKIASPNQPQKFKLGILAKFKKPTLKNLLQSSRSVENDGIVPRHDQVFDSFNQWSNTGQNSPCPMENENSTFDSDNSDIDQISNDAGYAEGNVLLHHTTNESVT